MAISNSPSALTVQHFRSALDEYGQVAKGARFAVRIIPQGSNNLLMRLGYSNQIPYLIYVCDAAEFPGRGFNVSTTRYYGPEINVPNTVMYGPTFGLSFICRNNSLERQFFDDWQDAINPVSTFNYNYPKQYYCSVEVYQFSEIANQQNSHEAIYSWRYVNCWPNAVSPQQVTWADDNILRLGVVMTFKYWNRPGDKEKAYQKFQ